MAELFTSQSFSGLELQSALQAAVNATHEVAGPLKENFGVSPHETKHGDPRDWVTHWDKWAEAVAKQRLANYSKDIGALGEEGGFEGSSEVYWTFDMIDATSHFVRGNEFCTSMIALVDHGVPVAGVIHDFVRGDTYTAAAGQGAFKNGTTRLHASRRPIEASYVELYTAEDTPQGRQLRTAIEKTGAYLLRSAAAGHTFITVARGSTEGFMALDNPFGSEWDIAPGSLLVHEAGGVVHNIGPPGLPDGFTSRNFNFIAAGPETFAALATIAGQVKVA